MATRTIIATALAARIGYSGRKIHTIRVSVEWKPEWRGEPGHAAVYTGQTHCGSQRSLSGWYLVGLDPTKVNCERCLQRNTTGALADRESSWETGDGTTVRYFSLSDSSKVVQKARGWVEPTPWAAETVTPETER